MIEVVPSNFQCVDCGAKYQPDKGPCSGCGRVYEYQHGILLAWPKNMAPLAKEEAEHHDHDDSDAVEVHQLNRPRNLYYHEQLWQKMKELPKGADILEIGAGTGFDAQKLMGEYGLTLTDVSPETLARLGEKLNDPNIGYIAADGSHLPFISGSFAGVYMVATLHHLPDVKQGINEFGRVLQPGGQLVIAIEPNATYFRWIKYFRKSICRVIHMDPHEGSHADAEMRGFSYRELKNLFSNNNWNNFEIKPVWFLAGWWHYSTEFLFRSLRLKKRLVLPSALEWILVYLDELLFKIPGVKHLAWHWYISATKL